MTPQLISADGKVPGLPAGGQASDPAQQAPRAPSLGQLCTPTTYSSSYSSRGVCEVPLSWDIQLKRQLQVLYSFIGRYADYTITNTPAPVLGKMIHFLKLAFVPGVL